MARHRNLLTLARLTLCAALLAAAFGALPAQPARAAGTILVTGAADSTATDGVCTLKEAVANANADAAVYSDCAPGAGADTITFADALNGATLTFTTPGGTTFGPSALEIASDITLMGNPLHGQTLTRSGDEMRLVYIAPGAKLTLQYLTLRDGLARGGAGAGSASGGSGGGAAGVGGAIFNRGELVLSESLLVNNQAIGGAGGDRVFYYSCFSHGGGGGGVGGPGTSLTHDGYSCQGGSGGPPNPGKWPSQTVGYGGGGAPGIWGAYDPAYSRGGPGGEFGGGGGGAYDYFGGHIGGDAGFGGGGGGGGSSSSTFHSPGAKGLGGFGGGNGGPGGIDTYEFQVNATGGGGGGMGGALFNATGATASLTNVTLSANLAQGGRGGNSSDSSGNPGDGGSGFGGAIFNQGATIHLTHVTLHANQVVPGTGGNYNGYRGLNGGADGGALYLHSLGANLSSLTMHGTIAYASTGGTDLASFGAGAGLSGSHNLVGTTELLPGGLTWSAADALLAPLADNGGASQTHALAPGSPALDSGNPVTAPTADQRGAVRDAAPDIGAYEQISTAPVVVNSLADTVADDGTTTLREALIAVNFPVGPSEVRFDPALAGQTIELTTIGDQAYGPSALMIANDVVIDGAGAPGLIIRRAGSAPAMRLFYIAPGATATLARLTLQNGLARGGDGYYGGGGGAGLGGALFNRGDLTLEGVTLSDNQAVGGLGGMYGGIGGGGGGLGGPGDWIAGGGPNGGANYGASGGEGGGGAGGMNTIAGAGGNGGFGGGGGGGGQSPSPFYSGGLGGGGGFGGGSGSGGANTDLTLYSLGGSPGLGGGSAFVHLPGGGAGMGGAIFNHGGNLALTNCTLSANRAEAPGINASAWGGALANRNGATTIAYSTFNQNAVVSPSGYATGGSVANLADGGPATMTIDDSILANCAGCTSQETYNLNGALTENNNLAGLVALAGLALDAGAYAPTHAIDPASPAVDSGLGTAPARDQRGVLRDNRPDRGAYELDRSAGPVYADLAGACAGARPCFTGIQNAIDYAAPGAEVRIFQAGYTENVTIDHPVQVMQLGNLTLLGDLSIEQGSFNQAGYDLGLAYNLSQTGGAFLASGGRTIFQAAGTQTITGDFTFQNVSVSPGATVETSSAIMVLGAVENAGLIRETRPLGGAGSNAGFGLSGVTLEVESAGFTQMQVERRDESHPQATSALQTGRWWRLTPSGADGVLLLRLPHANLSDPQVCKYPGELGGYGWDCARSAFTPAYVYRSGLMAFSDWTVGSSAGPTAVRLTGLQAAPASQKPALPTLAAFGALLLGLAAFGCLRRRAH